MADYKKTKQEYINDYICVLKDLCILRSRAHKQELQVRLILDKCNDEFAMSRKTHDLRLGNETLSEFIARN